MSIFLKILLLVLGSISALAAFGGETWKKGPEPLLQRINSRGWTSLICLALTLIVGSISEIISRATEQRLQKERNDAEANLKSANSKLDAVQNELQAEEKRLAEANIALTTANTNLTNLRDNLISTKAQLSRESEINLLTVLSRDNPVKRAAWLFEMKNPPHQGVDIFDFLFSKLPPEYREVVNGRLIFEPFLGLGSEVDYRPEKGRVLVIYPLDTRKDFIPPTIHVPAFLDPDPIWRMASRDEPRAPVIFIMGQEASTSDRYTNAAIAYRDLSRHSEVGELTLDCGRDFNSQEALKSFLAARPFLKATEGRFGSSWTMRCELPGKIAKVFFQYWSSNFIRSDVHLYLDNSAHLMISCSAAIQRREKVASRATIIFNAITQPQLEVGIDRF